MNTETHPDTDTLRAYMRDIESPDYGELRLHLASCPSCRGEVDTLSALLNNYAAIDNTPQHSEELSETQHAQIIDYVEGRLDAKSQAEVTDLIHSNQYAMKSALHYSSHRAAVTDETLIDEPVIDKPVVDKKIDAVKTSSDHVSLFSRIGKMLTGWLDIRAPVWAAVPATALAVLAVVLSLPSISPWTGSDATSDFIVANYQDSTSMRFSASSSFPGIGFFSRADRYSKAYNNVEVNVTSDGDAPGGKLQLHWPSVKNAVTYTMRLQLFDRGNKTPVGEISTVATTAAFDVDQIYRNKRYEWVLSGDTTDEKTFYASGGFVISKTDDGDTD